MGPQGCGKGTQAKLLSEELRIPHISTGALLREYVQKDTPVARKLKAIMDRGDLVDDEFLEKILEERLGESDCVNGFILDGTPRDEAQLEMLKRFLDFDKAILIDLPDEECLRRIAARAEKEGRSDDTPEGAKHRLEIYHTRTEPVIEFFEEKGILLRINGNQSIEEVFTELKEALLE